jgi:hypothetical protein
MPGADENAAAAVAEGPAVAEVAREAFVHAMSRASLVVALVAAAGAVVAARHLPARGQLETARADRLATSSGSRQ